MSDEERRELIARQRSALYGEGPFAETGGYVDETGATRPGIPAPHAPGPAGLRGPSPLTYDFAPNSQPEGTPSGNDPNQPNSTVQRSRANSASSPHSNTPSNKGVFENATVVQQSTCTSNSSPSGSPPRQGAVVGGKPNQAINTVAPIGTRPSAAPPATAQTSGNKRSSPPLTSPLNRAPGASEDGFPSGSTAPSNHSTASADASVSLGRWGGRGGVWGSKSGLQTSTSVWG